MSPNKTFHFMAIALSLTVTHALFASPPNPQQEQVGVVDQKTYCDAVSVGWEQRLSDEWSDKAQNGGVAIGNTYYLPLKDRGRASDTDQRAWAADTANKLVQKISRDPQLLAEMAAWERGESPRMSDVASNKIEGFINELSWANCGGFKSVNDILSFKCMADGQSTGTPPSRPLQEGVLVYPRGNIRPEYRSFKICHDKGSSETIYCTALSWGDISRSLHYTAELPKEEYKQKFIAEATARKRTETGCPFLKEPVLASATVVGDDGAAKAEPFHDGVTYDNDAMVCRVDTLCSAPGVN